MLRRWRTVVGVFFVTVGITGLLVPFLSFSVASPDDVLIFGQPTAPSAPASEKAPTDDIARADVAERLFIEGVGIDMPLFTGGLDEALRKGAWLMGGTRPGELGNTVIFGHRFKYLPPLSNTMFRLGSVEYGDTFTVRWNGEELTYIVREIRVIDPTEVSVIGDMGDERVTLVTCHPVWSTKERLIVVGFPVEASVEGLSGTFDGVTVEQ